jgi:DNA-binding GntR family transcriptional regulator
MTLRTTPQTPRRAVDAGPGSEDSIPDEGGSFETGYEPASIEVCAGVRRRILDGSLEPGARIRQEVLAAEYGVSRIPVREALRQLENEGLVTQVPHAGARVSSITIEECLELYRLREALEPEILFHSVPLLSDDDLHELDQTMKRLVAAGGDWRTWLLEDRLFHLGSFQAAPMPTGLRLIERFYNQTQPSRRAYFSVLDEREMEIVRLEHRLLFDAIARRDPDDAKSLQRSHIRRTRVNLMRDPRLATSPRGDAAARSPRIPKKTRSAKPTS